MDNENKATKWSFEVTEKVGDVEKCTRVRQVENGYIVRISKNWKEDNEYKWEEKEFISKENPIPSLTKKEETTEEVSAIKGLFDSLGDGLISVE